MELCRWFAGRRYSNSLSVQEIILLKLIKGWIEIFGA
jgi:hypothetical protein